MQVNSIGQQVGTVSLSHAGAVDARNSTDCSGYVSFPPRVRKIPSPPCFLTYKGPVVIGCTSKGEMGPAPFF